MAGRVSKGRRVAVIGEPGLVREFRNYLHGRPRLTLADVPVHREPPVRLAVAHPQHPSVRRWLEDEGIDDLVLAVRPPRRTGPLGTPLSRLGRTVTVAADLMDLPGHLHAPDAARALRRLEKPNLISSFAGLFRVLNWRRC